MEGHSGGVSARHLTVVVLVGLVLVAGGTAIASWVMTGGGDISIQDASFETDSGLELSATVYEPPEVSADEPAPVVTLIHGYTGERGTMSSFARELADRGYVAVAVDQPGHGVSDPPAFEDGWGGPATLEFARSLDITDEDRVAMVGHSMGGFASLAAAEAHPDGYDSLVLLGSTWGAVTGLGEIPEANETFPRNLALLFAPYDEFAPSMYGESIPGNVPATEKVKSVFGTDERVEAGEIYGSIDDGTARLFTAPPTVHTGMHRSTTTVDDVLDWVALTLGEPADEESQGTYSVQDDDQPQGWYWATAGHVGTLLGVLLVAVGVTGLVWRWIALSDADSMIAESSSESDSPAIGSSTESDLPAIESPFGPDISAFGSHSPSRRLLVGASLLPAVTIVPLYALGTVLVPLSRVTHQELTHGYVLWMLGTVALAAFVVHRRYGGVTDAVTSLLADRRGALRAIACAIAGFAAAYLLVWAVSHLPGSGARAWLVGLAPLPSLRWLSAFVYVWPLLVAGFGFSLALFAILERDGNGLTAGLGRALVVTCGGLAVFLVAFYAPLFAGFGVIADPLGPMSTQIMRSTMLVAIATWLAVGTANATERPLAGGVLAALFVTWFVVATGPIHVAPL